MFPAKCFFVPVKFIFFIFSRKSGAFCRLQIPENGELSIFGNVIYTISTVSK